MSHIFLFAALFLAAGDPGAISGSAVVIDGDTLDIGGERVRLFGIDAPELSQKCEKAGQSWACGREAKERLDELVRGQAVRCQQVEYDVHGRSVARCRAGDADLNRLMVASGFAVAFRRYSHDYVSAEESARLAGRGLWAGSFKDPSEYRAVNGEEVGAAPRSRRSVDQPVRSQRRPVAAKSPGLSGQPARGACVIKGNHSRRGEWIYHLPGMPYYEKTRPEACFCSEAEAQAAGYRRAKVR